MRTAIQSHDDRSFGDQLLDQLKNAPWVACSIGAHGVLALMVALYPWNRPEPAEARQVIEMRAPEEVPDLIDKELEAPDPPDVPDRTEKTEDEPEIPNVPLDETHQINTESLHEESFGENRSSHHAHEFAGTNATIGVGGNFGGGGFGGRGGNKNTSGRGSGATRETERTVELGLEWLARHQSEDGRWEADNYERHCTGPRNWGAGEAAYTPGVSGLALLCFLGHGDTHQVGDSKDVVKRGLKYLKSIQDAEGCFGPRTSQHFQYNHSIAALAMTEAYGMTNSRLFKSSAQQGVNFVHQSQNPYMAWRYGVRDGDNDTSVTGWMVMVLKSAKMAELDVDMTAMKGAVAWVDKMTEGEFGRVGYQQRGGQPARHSELQDKFPADQSESLTAVGLTTRIFAGQSPKDEPLIDKHVQLLSKKLPNWDIDSGEIDMYYWYYGTLAMFQLGGNEWKRWNAAMKTAIIDQQITDPGICARGSWDPVGPWGEDGGRVYSTALMTLCLEVYYRYGRVVGTY